MVDESILEGNGHDPDSDEAIREGAVLPLELLEREDGILARAASSASRNNSGVINKLLTAVEASKDYRQELKTGNYSSPRKALEAADAIREAIILGDTEGLEQIIDEIIALKAGANSALVHEALEALTHTSFTTNYAGNNGQRNQQNNGKKNSPIT
jgi:hypothetical protein